MIDTHTHLYLDAFDADRDAAMQRAFDAGVERMIFPNVDLTTIEPMKELHSRYADRTAMAMGLHPTEIDAAWEEPLSRVLAELADGSDYVAVGEIGIDLYRDTTFAAEQMEVFDRQCAAAARLGLPVIIHCREGLDRTLEVMAGHKGLGCVFHSFGGTPQDVDRIRRVCGDGVLFGINGVVTFKNGRLEPAVGEITASRILLETDSPYLAPVPHRGKRNESSMLPLVRDRIAAILGMTPEAVDAATTVSAEHLFFRQKS